MLSPRDLEQGKDVLEKENYRAMGNESVVAGDQGWGMWDC